MENIKSGKDFGLLKAPDAVAFITLTNTKRQLRSLRNPIQVHRIENRVLESEKSRPYRSKLGT